MLVKRAASYCHAHLAHVTFVLALLCATREHPGSLRVLSLGEMQLALFGTRHANLDPSHC